MLMRYLGGGIGHVATREAVNKFEKVVRETLGLGDEMEEDNDVDMHVDMGEMGGSSDLEDDEIDEDSDSLAEDSDSDLDSDSDVLEYLDEPDEQYTEEEVYVNPEA